MNEVKDWYPTDGATERLMYGNVELKIDGYVLKYPFLTTDYVKDIHTMCRTFIEAYDKIEYNRATGKQATQWFANLMTGAPQGEAAPAPPVYMTITLPPAAFIGIEKSFREFAGLFKKQLNYDAADGFDLMIEREKADKPDMSAVSPALKMTAADTAVRVEWKKSGFDALELQYRKIGATMWQAGDKSTTGDFDFTPSLITPGVPEKFEFRAVYLIKNQRVGNWSPIYTMTVG